MFIVPSPVAVAVDVRGLDGRRQESPLSIPELTLIRWVIIILTALREPTASLLETEPQVSFLGADLMRIFTFHTKVDSKN